MREPRARESREPVFTAEGFASHYANIFTPRRRDATPLRYQYPHRLPSLIQGPSDMANAYLKLRLGALPGEKRRADNSPIKPARGKKRKNKTADNTEDISENSAIDVDKQNPKVTCDDIRTISFAIGSFNMACRFLRDNGDLLDAYALEDIVPRITKVVDHLTVKKETALLEKWRVPSNYNYSWSWWEYPKSRACKDIKKISFGENKHAFEADAIMEACKSVQHFQEKDAFLVLRLKASRKTEKNCDTGVKGCTTPKCQYGGPYTMRYGNFPRLWDGKLPVISIPLNKNYKFFADINDDVYRCYSESCNWNLPHCPGGTFFFLITFYKDGQHDS